MIVEFGEMPVAPEKAEAFERAWKLAEKILVAQPGYLSHRLGRKVAQPQDFILEIEWDTIEAHLEGFVKSESFPRFLGYFQPLLSSSPRFFHFNALSG